MPSETIIAYLREQRLQLTPEQFDLLVLAVLRAYIGEICPREIYRGVYND